MTEFDHRQVIAIDGPAAAGKTTVALALANRLNALLFDTGALYRAVTLAAHRNHVPLDDEASLADLAERLRIELGPASIDDGRQLDVRLDGEDVTWAIRSAAIDASVSQVSAQPGVRSNLLALQREIADGSLVVMVGRDIGTIVAPMAGTKFFLDASAEERARRRVIDLQTQGNRVSHDQVLADIRARDLVDSSRVVSPLAEAADAISIRTDGRSVDDIVDELERIVDSRHASLGVS